MRTRVVDIPISSRSEVQSGTIHGPSQNALQHRRLKAGVEVDFRDECTGHVIRVIEHKVEIRSSTP